MVWTFTQLSDIKNKEIGNKTPFPHQTIPAEAGMVYQGTGDCRPIWRQFLSPNQKRAKSESLYNLGGGIRLVSWSQDLNITTGIATLHIISPCSQTKSTI